MNAPDPKLGSLIVPPTETRIIRAFGGEMHLHLSGEQTGKRLVVATLVAEPGHGPPPHYHQQEDECFVVLEGSVSFLAAGKWQEVGVGGVVFTPKGTVHTYRNDGLAKAKMLFTALPSGFEVFFAACEVEFQKPGGPDMARIIAISAEHGIQYV